MIVQKELNLALIESILNEDITLTNNLLAKGADVNYVSEKENSPLLAAIGTMNYELVNALLKKGAHANPDPIPLYTVPLNEAVDTSVQDFLNNDDAEQVSIDIIKLLAEHGANPLAKDKHGKTAYDLSINYNKPAEVYFKYKLGSYTLE